MDASTQRAVVIIGLPSSGKTTFLAALWHLICARDVQTRLRFGDLRSGDIAHLNSIADRWRNARVQDRTSVNDTRLVSINLKDQKDSILRVTFPDVAGEAYRQMWEDRECTPEVANILREGGVLLFIHADNIKAPQWVVEVAQLSQQLGVPGGGDQESIPWHPQLAPTQVQIVSLLSLMREAPLDAGPRRLAVMLSAWDKARDEQLAPEAFLAAKLPLLYQYLRQEMGQWEWRVYGLSAQGGDYDAVMSSSPSPDADRLRALDSPSKRIQLVLGETTSHDLTEPLEWLMD